MSAVDAGKALAAPGDRKESPPPEKKEVVEEVKNNVPTSKVVQPSEPTKEKAANQGKATNMERSATVEPTQTQRPTPGADLLKARPAKSAKAPESKQSPHVDEPSVYAPLPRIDPLTIENAEEPLVQDLVRTLNDIITVINGDNAGRRFGSTISKAKSELSTVGKRILDLKQREKEAMQNRIRDLESQFDNGARDLVSRLEEEMNNQESRWREEFEHERTRISDTYEERLQSEINKTKELSEIQFRNQMLEQAIAMKNEFLSQVTNQVETERNGRLGKLSELASNVHELEDLTTKWNSVIDANLQTQHLQVAVEAVRASLENSDRPHPFIKELATLKEVASNDPVVDSAIASINPIAYQKGVPTSAQIIDRFRRVAAEVRKASLLPDDAGLASHATSVLLSKIFRKPIQTGGNDVESVLARTEILLEEGNLDDAAREMNATTGWAKTLSSDWLAEVRRVLEVRQALDVSHQSTFRIPMTDFVLGHLDGSSSAKFESRLKGLSCRQTPVSKLLYF